MNTPKMLTQVLSGGSDGRTGFLVAAERLKRTIKRRIKAKNADVLLVSHAKSGRTWLATMISYVYIYRSGLPETEVLQFDRLRKRDARVPRLLLSHDNQKDAAKTPLFKPHQLAGKKIVLLVRHPCDIAVSAYFQSLRDSRKGLAPDHGNRPIFDYLIDDKLVTVLAFLKRWQAQVQSMESAIVVRYEDLRARPAEELSRLMTFIDGAADPVEIEAAVSFAEIGRMREREATGFFASDKLQPGDPSDPRSFKVREGKVGGYRERFSAAELAQIDAMVAAADLSGFGYTVDT